MRTPTKVYIVTDSRDNFVKIYRLKYYAEQKCLVTRWDRTTKTSFKEPNGNVMTTYLLTKEEASA